MAPPPSGCSLAPDMSADGRPAGGGLATLAEEVAVAPGSRSALQMRLDEVAATLEGVRRRAGDGDVRYEREGIPFAVVAGDRAAFRLTPDIARAALRTPDVRASDRGTGWVELVPDRLDVFTVDRAVSWFESAARHAGE